MNKELKQFQEEVKRVGHFEDKDYFYIFRQTSVDWIPTFKDNPKDKNILEATGKLIKIKK